MPRKKRQLSSSNIYHVVIKGLDRQIIFEEKKDYIKYLDLLEHYSYECNFDIYAYCLMSNHIHLVICTSDISLETFFRKINTHYAIWFNMKYQRTGHLQQDRFYSEPIEDKYYLLSAIRYVHLNPFHAGCEDAPGTSYPWSSYAEYFHNEQRLINTDFIFSLISHDSFLEFHKSDNGAKHIDVDTVRKRVPDDVAKDIIYEVTSCSTSTDFQKLPISVRKRYLCCLNEKGLSIRQLNRLTGIPKGFIECTVRKENKTEGRSLGQKNRP